MAAVHSTRTRSSRLFASASKPTTSHAGPSQASSRDSSHGLVSGASSLSLFLTNLKLLDLDLLPDWPEISNETFVAAGASAQGQKKRVQCVEWALFQLFSLWDPEETRNKLKPFFPPLDQVQSINLRAALLRLLEQIKKNGVLGRDAIIRKTMLDECKGERLAEILSAFSGAVLKKVIEEEMSANGEYPAVALEMALEERGYKRENTDLALLTWTHKASLQNLLREKSKARAQFRTLADSLDAKEKEFAARAEDIQNRETSGSGKTLSNDVKIEMRRTIRNNWTGDERWMETILTGDAASKKDSLLGMPFDKVWRRVQQGRLDELEESGGGLLEELEGRVQVQRERLQKWEGFRKQMCEDRPPPSPSKQRAAQSNTKGIDLGFGSHEGLQVGRTSPTRKATLGAQDAVLSEEYARLVRGLEDDLSRTDPKQSTTLSFLRKPRLPHHHADMDSSFTDHDENVSEMSDLEEDMSQSFPGDDPPRSLQSKLDQSRRGPVRPILSPSRNSGVSRPTSPVSRASRGSMAGINTPGSLSPRRGSPSPEILTPRSGSTRASPTRPEQKLNSASTPVLPPPSPTQEVADQILESMNMASPSPTKRPKPRHTLSLAERTRLSLNHKPSLFLDEEEPELPIVPAADTTHAASADEMEESLTDEELEDLASRTRKSMAGYEKARQMAQLERRRSQRQPRPLQRKEDGYFPAVEEDRTMLTEELLAEQDMEAVFKSRPRIKESPLPSPTRSERDASDMKASQNIEPCSLP